MIAVRLPIMMCQTQMTLVAVVIHTARVILAMSVLFVVVSRMSLLFQLKGFMMLCEQMGVVSPPQGSLETIHHLLVKLHFHVDMTRDE